MFKTLVKYIGEFKRDAVLTPVLVVMEVIMEVITQSGCCPGTDGSSPQGPIPGPHNIYNGKPSVENLNWMPYSLLFLWLWK